MAEIRLVALVPESTKVKFSEIAIVAGALQRQAQHHLPDFWDVSASVNAYEKLEDVPSPYWPIVIVDEVEGGAGIHLDKNGQPFALAEAGPSWSLTASHELLEMLVDPWGNRIKAAKAPTVKGKPKKLSTTTVEYLVEICDPSEDAQFAYQIDSILVSDFYTNEYFAPQIVPGVRYSFTGAIKEPRDVLDGGYVSFRDPTTNHWWQILWLGTDQPQYHDIGELDISTGSVRETLRRSADERRKHYRNLSHVARSTKSFAAALTARASVDNGAKKRADQLRERIAELR